jgi:hypothetical protein
MAVSAFSVRSVAVSETDRLAGSELGVAVSTRALGLLDHVAAQPHEPSVEARACLRPWGKPPI